MALCYPPGGTLRRRAIRKHDAQTPLPPFQSPFRAWKTLPRPEASPREKGVGIALGVSGWLPEEKALIRRIDPCCVLIPIASMSVTPGVRLGSGALRAAR